MDQTLQQVCSLVGFQLRTVAVSLFLSLRLGLSVLWSSLLELGASSASGQSKNVTSAIEGASEAQEWVVVGNAERTEKQAKSVKRKKKGKAASTAAGPQAQSVSEGTTVQKPTEASEGYWFYEGVVRHHRVHPVSHFFQYKVRYALVNLDCCPAWFQESSAALHMSASEARAYAGTEGAVWLLTYPVSVGYEQNPISVYYCYKDKVASVDALVVCIAEVTNTPWGERVLFTFDASGDLVPKPLHVSPFIDMSSSWRIKASPPGKSLELTFVARHPELGPYFTATLQATRVTKTIKHPAAFFWLMPHKVAVWIYWQAFRLWWKGVSPLSHPKYADGAMYQERVLDRATKEEGLSKELLTKKQALRSSGVSCPVFSWRDASGPPWL